MIEPKELKMGDILLTKDKTHHFFRHVYVVTTVDKDNGIYKIIHWLGIREPFSITEATLPSKELLDERNLELECFRLYDEKQAEKAADILKKWLEWGVPYSQERFQKLESEMNRFFSVSSDLMKMQPPQGCKEKFPEKLEASRAEMETLFIKNYRDIIKYAARRDISPVRPKQVSKQNGFHCVQGILIAFQVSYVTELVHSITDKWLADKHTENNSHLNNSGIFFESMDTALKNNVEPETLMAKIPMAFRLYAKLCWVDTFRHAMLADTETILFLGSISPLNKADIKPDAEEVALRVKCLTEMGFLKKEQLLQEVILPSARIIM